ncbi:MAG TPA: ABC transporter permease subunit [Actinomycetota bacterium]|nr:ABC transporter permease subunit [Actinomycetota bacterium]
MTEKIEERGPERVAATAGGAAPIEGPPPSAASRRGRRKALIGAVVFLLPALVILGALVMYPIFFSIIRSLFDKSGDTFIGLQNYQDIFTSDRTFTALKNTLIWVVVAPSIVTALGLVFAVLTERVRWGTAFKVAIFMPMAISFLSVGVIWRLVYEENPNVGLANAAAQGVVDTFRSPGPYPGARPSTDTLQPQGEALATTGTFSPGETVDLGLLAVSQDLIPESAQEASTREPPSDGISGAVWLDFTRGGGGEAGVIDSTESGLPGAVVEAVRDGEVVATAESEDDGSYVLSGLEQGDYTVRLAASNFRPPFGGYSWLGPTLVTPAIIVSFIWMWAGFAMVVIGAGLAAIPRDVLEAARVDGANERQVFRRVTVPLLAPVLGVVLVTLVINVLKIFDLVLIIAPGSVQRDANVIALEMWKASFGGANDFGLGSALAIFLFVLVVPAMLFNIRRFRQEQ